VIHGVGGLLVGCGDTDDRSRGGFSKAGNVYV